MRCYICGKVILIKRTIQTLFHFKPIFRCNSCTKKHRLDFFRQDIPKENGMFYLYSLFKEDNEINWLAFNDEVSKWFNEILKKANNDDYILWLDKIDIETLESLDCLFKDIYVLTKTALKI